MLKINHSLTKKILVEFIRDKTYKAGFKNVVLGLSGGVDSSLVAYLACQALGKKNVFLYFLPYTNSSSIDMEHAKYVACRLDASFEIISIEGIVDAYIQKEIDISKIRKGNVMARARMIVLYDQSAKNNALVIGTSNKTEVLLGYGTQYGDTACALNPIGDLYKTQVRQLASYIGVSTKIMAKVPSAGLWEGQTDEGELGFSYDEADQILYYLFDERLKKEDVAKKGYNEEVVSEIIERVKNNKFKSRLPVIPKISKF